LETVSRYSKNHEVSESGSRYYKKNTDPGIPKTQKNTTFWKVDLGIVKNTDPGILKTQKNTTFRKLDSGILKNTKEHKVSETSFRYSKKTQKNTTFRKLDPGILKNMKFRKVDPGIIKRTQIQVFQKHKEHTVSETGSRYSKKHKRTQRFGNWIQLF
jgi:hypothetical protein